MLKVSVADDSKFMQATYRKVLESEKNIQVVATVSDGQEAVCQAQASRPHVVILDIRMPNVGGIEAARQISARRPSIGIVIVSACEDSQPLVDLLNIDARGKAYIHKTSLDDVDILIRAVEGVARGETIFHLDFS